MEPINLKRCISDLHTIPILWSNHEWNRHLPRCHHSVRIWIRTTSTTMNEKALTQELYQFGVCSFAIKWENISSPSGRLSKRRIPHPMWFGEVYWSESLIGVGVPWFLAPQMYPIDVDADLQHTRYKSNFTSLCVSFQFVSKLALSANTLLWH